MRTGGPTLVLWEMAGAVFIICVGSALHFTFVWSGRLPVVALVAAVNESIWEHLKLAFWPGLLWALLPPSAGGAPLLSRLAARGVSLAATAGLIVTIFTGYTAILGDNLLALDIGTFVVAVIAGQGLAAWLIPQMARWRRLASLGLAALALQFAAYAAFTFHPPQHWLFVDSRTGITGIPPE